MNTFTNRKNAYISQFFPGESSSSGSNKDVWKHITVCVFIGLLILVVIIATIVKRKELATLTIKLISPYLHTTSSSDAADLDSTPQPEITQSISTATGNINNSDRFKRKLIEDSRYLSEWKPLESTPFMNRPTSHTEDISSTEYDPSLPYLRGPEHPDELQSMFLSNNEIFNPDGTLNIPDYNLLKNFMSPIYTSFQ